MVHQYRTQNKTDSILNAWENLYIEDNYEEEELIAEQMQEQENSERTSSQQNKEGLQVCNYFQKLET